MGLATPYPPGSSRATQSPRAADVGGIHQKRQGLLGALSTNRAAGSDCLGSSCFNQAVSYIFLLNGMSVHFKRLDQALSPCADETII